MNTSDLISSVSRKVQDSSYSEDDILELLNAGLIEVASGGDRQHGNALLPPLPDLFTVDIVTLLADEPFVAMPAEYLRDLARVEYNGQALKKYSSKRVFLSRFAGDGGLPSGYCLVGSNLWIGPAQTGNTDLKVFFSAKPSPLSADSDEPECIPSHLHRRLLVNYACKEIFSEIEQGVDGAMPNTMKHDVEYQRALTDLERFLGPADGEAENIADDYYTDDMIV